ncbi:MAG: hypothetical protein LBF60_09030 [Treponema sp.]|nr:hypothetical protein [Treponema sp.]
MIAAALGACGEGWGNQEPSPQASETGAPDIAYNTGELVTVKVRAEEPQQSQSGAKSIAPDAALWFTNTYEVIFRKIGTSPDTDVYYRGVGAGAQEYISVEVPIGEEYEVLLIAGIDQTLVGAGYRGKNLAGTQELDSSNDYGYTIYVGIMPHGGATLEQAASEKHYLMKAPADGKGLSHYRFTRRRKERLLFETGGCGHDGVCVLSVRERQGGCGAVGACGFFRYSLRRHCGVRHLPGFAVCLTPLKADMRYTI